MPAPGWHNDEWPPGQQQPQSPRAHQQQQAQAQVQPQPQQRRRSSPAGQQQDGTRAQQPSHFKDMPHPPPASRQQQPLRPQQQQSQQRQQSPPPQQPQPPGSRQFSGTPGRASAAEGGPASVPSAVASASAVNALYGRHDGRPDAGVIGAVTGLTTGLGPELGTSYASTHDFLSWDPLQAAGESFITPPLMAPLDVSVGIGRHSLFPPTSAAAATAAAASGGFSPDVACLAPPPLRNNSQVLLPPLLMRMPAGTDDAEPTTMAMMFFGPGVLPGLLAGSPPPGPVDSGGGGGARMLAGPTFLHVAPAAASRQHVSGMVAVPAAAPTCKPGGKDEDDDDDLLLGGGAYGDGAAAAAATAASAGSCVTSPLMPSGAAVLAAYQRSLAAASNSTAAAAVAAAASAAATAAAASAAAAHDSEYGKQKPQRGGSWLLLTNAMSRFGSGLETLTAGAGGGCGGGGGKVSGQMPPLAAAPEPVGAGDVHTTPAAQQKQLEQGQQQPLDWAADPSNISLAHLRPFNTGVQLPLDLLDASGGAHALELAGATLARASAGGGGAGRGHSADTNTDAEEVAELASGWLTSRDGDCSSSRRYCRGAGSVPGVRAVVASLSANNRERRSSIRFHTAADGECDGGEGQAAAIIAASTVATRLPSPPAGHGSVQARGSLSPHLRTSSAVRPCSDGEVARKAAASVRDPRAGGGGRVGGPSSAGSTRDGRCGGSDSGGAAAASETPLTRWQRAARTAGLTASIARSFRTLRNQHEENLVREEQLKVLGEIGSGSFARVDKCQYTPPDGGKPFLVAVKRIKPEMLHSRDPEDLQLFVQEAQLLRKLNHPHIVQYIGLGIILADKGSSSSRGGGCGGGGGGGGRGGGDKAAALNADQLLELNRRSWASAVRAQEKEREMERGPRSRRSSVTSVASVATAASNRKPHNHQQRNPPRYHRRQIDTQLPRSAKRRSAAEGAERPGRKGHYHRGGGRRDDGRGGGGNDEGDEEEEEEGEEEAEAEEEQEAEEKEGADPPPPLPALLRGVFIVEEFLAGGTLKGAVYQQMLRPQRQLYSNATALRWMAQVAGALSYMHTCRPKVLHRDIKLDNVLLQPQPPAGGNDGHGGGGTMKDLYDGCVAKLGDLGLAALLAHHRRPSTVLGGSDQEWEGSGGGGGGSAGSQHQSSPNGRTVHSQASYAVRQCMAAAAQLAPHLRPPDDAARLSRLLESHKRDRLGTYMYMAPEVYQRQKYDEKCDCFSFAVLLYEVFHRFITACSLDHANQMQKYARQVSQGFRPAIHEDIPPPLSRVIRQCWAQDPAQRPDMASVARELRALEARGVVAALDRRQQTAAGLLGCCCCVS